MEIYKGRPEDCRNRQPREVRVYDFLDSLGVEYDRLDHPAADTMEVCGQIDAAFGRISIEEFRHETAVERRGHAIVCKNLFLRNKQGTNHYLLMMPGDKKFLTKNLSAQINSARLSFATPEEMLEMLDILPGSVSVMGLINDSAGKVQLLMDEDVLSTEYIGFHPCVNTSSLRMHTRVLLDKVLPAMYHTPVIVKL